MKTAVIFDLDGTLVDSLEDLANSANEVLLKNQYPTHEKELYKKMIGDGAKKLIERALPKATSESEVDRVLEEYLVCYKKNVGKSTAPFSGILDLLSELNEKKILIGVATNKPIDLSYECLSRCFPENTFLTVQGAKEGIHPKPNPEMLLLASEELSVPPENCVFLGDSDVDMIAAHNAKMKAVGAEWGMRSKEELEKSGAHHVIKYPEQLLPIITEMIKS